MSDTRQFLDKVSPFYGQELLNLVAIDPRKNGDESGHIIGRFFAPDERDAQMQFVDQYRETHNLYYALNPVRSAKPQRKTGRATKEKVSHLIAVAIDTDPSSPVTEAQDKARAKRAIENCPLQPTGVIDSGRGLQALWYLATPQHINGNIEQLEKVSKHLEAYFRAQGIACDPTFSVEHIFRLPGTINHLNKRKIADGYTGKRPTALESWSDAQHDPGKILALQIAEPTDTATDEPVAEPRAAPQPTDRSADLLRHVRGMVFAGDSDEEIEAQCAGHPHVLENPDPKRAIQRCISKAREALKQIGEDCIGIHLGVIEEFKHAPRDVAILPNDYVPISVAALRIGRLLARHHEAFVRGGCVVELNKRELEVITPQAFRSRIERRRRVKHFVKMPRSGELVLVDRRCSIDLATAMLASKELQSGLPPIVLVANASVLIEHDGELVTLGKGYHEEGGGVLVLDGETPPTVPLAKAVGEIAALLDDYLFTTTADKSRAIAALLGPALRMGKFIQGHALMLAMEAMKSQTGKGHFLELIRSLYNEEAFLVTIREGGVGSFDESFGNGLISGKPFVCIDNVRTRFPSQTLEAMLTSYTEVAARIPYRGEVMVDASRVSIQLTSNGVEMTSDLANRAMIVRLLKQPDGYGFKVFDGGRDLLAHVKANQPRYAGCIFAVVREWYSRGKPVLPTNHSFREWVGSLDWIIRNLFNATPLMEGHIEAVERTSDKALSWLRLIAIKALDEWKNGEPVSASALVALAERADIPIPGAAAKTEAADLPLLVGTQMARCFKDDDIRVLDSISIRRTKVSFYDDCGRVRNQPQYQFWKEGTPAPATPGARDAQW